MHVISRKRLNEFAARYPDTRASLARWYWLARRNDFLNFAELRAIFPSADRVGKLTVFNIGGNNVRRKIYVRSVLTHKEYDEQRWKE